MPTIILPPAPQPIAAVMANRAAAATANRPALRLPFVVVADDRERPCGWRFAGLAGDSGDGYRDLSVEVQYERLLTADYTIRRAIELTEPIAGNLFDDIPDRLDGLLIERKSHDDVIGSVGGGHVNFRAEHERLADVIRWGGYGCVIIESSFERVCQELDDGTAGRKYGSSVVRGIVASWPMQFGVPWLWAGTRQLAEDLAMRVMRKWWEVRTAGEPKPPKPARPSKAKVKRQTKAKATE